MNYTDIPKSTWRIVEIIILRYPDRKKEYSENLELILNSYPTIRIGQPYNNEISSPVEKSTMKINSIYMLKLQEEIKAIDAALLMFLPVEQEVIRTRYWKAGKKVSFSRIYCDYSESSMKRIVKRFIYAIARGLVEIE